MQSYLQTVTGYPNTGDTFNNMHSHAFKLTAGEHILTVCSDVGSGVKLESIKCVLVSLTCRYYVHRIRQRVCLSKTSMLAHHLHCNALLQHQRKYLSPHCSSLCAHVCCICEQLRDSPTRRHDKPLPGIRHRPRWHAYLWQQFTDCKQLYTALEWKLSVGHTVHSPHAIPGTAAPLSSQCQQYTHTYYALRMRL